MGKKEIQDLEQLFWDREAKKSKYKEELGGRKTAETVEKDVFLKELILCLGDIQGTEILDCGCGTGESGCISCNERCLCERV